MTKNRYRVSDELWEKIVPLLPEHVNTHRFGGASAPGRRPPRSGRNLLCATNRLPVQSFRSLMEELATQSRNVCRMTGDNNKGPTATMLAMPTVLPRRAFELLGCTQ